MLLLRWSTGLRMRDAARFLRVETIVVTRRKVDALHQAQRRERARRMLRDKQAAQAQAEREEREQAEHASAAPQAPPPSAVSQVRSPLAVAGWFGDRAHCPWLVCGCG